MTAWIGIVAVVLTLILTGMSMITAARQVQFLSQQRITDLREEASLLKENVINKSLPIVNSLLEQAGKNLLTNYHDRPFIGTAPPAWIDEAYVFDGRVLQKWTRQEDATWTLNPSASNRFERSEVFYYVVIGRLLPSLMAAEFDLKPKPIQFVYDVVNDEPIVVAYFIGQQAVHGNTVLGIHIDLDRFQADMINPRLNSNRVAVETVLPSQVPEKRENTVWTEDLGPIAPCFHLLPTKGFLERQQNVVHRQVILFITATILAITALLAVVWALWRVLKREIALSKMKQAFVADVSHELKTPLALIRLFGETLSSGRVPTEEKKKEYYEIITRESTRLTHLIDNILDFARIDANKKRYNMCRTDVVALIEKTYEAYRVQLDHEGFEHQLIIAEDLPKIWCDGDAIAQAVINLINNAMKYTDPEDKFLGIDLSRETRRGRHGILISVSDRGIGIKPEDRNHLFSGFYRANDDRVRKRRGAGLGLALVKHIVDAHNGIVDVESRLVKGSTFRIFLPVNSEETATEDNDNGQDTNS